MNKTVKVMEGSMAVANAIRSCKTDVIAAYPISPQTHIVEYLSDFAADGSLHGKYVNVDSEFSASSFVYGSAAAGARSYTASSSQGLLLMTEVLYNIAGHRLPLVMTGVNRMISPPISILTDHSDTMALRDCGFMQMHVESIQEAYDAHIQAFKIAENHKVLLPMMICMDGWVLTHAFEPVTLFDDADIQEFLGGPINSYQKLDPALPPVNYGVFTDEQELMEYKHAMMCAHENAKEVINEVAEEYREKFGHYYGGVIDTYMTEDADVILLAMGSVVGTIRCAIDEMRAEGKKVGLVKIRSFRPFPGKEIAEACAGAKAVGIIDKAISLGRGGIVGMDVKEYFCNMKEKPALKDYIAGIGGKELNREVIKQIYEDLLKVDAGNILDEEVQYVNLNEYCVE
ncbi:pyruvate ferredoxin oxidoreductase [Ihubacter sp. mB4P-1]|uniref:hypothetical protein n=1 Tax=Ihubacter sp. mB4P-1 TaxID=3242370 RepID=UPI003C7DFAB2